MERGKRIQRRQTDWAFSIVLVASLAVTAALGIFGAHDDPHGPFLWVYDTMYDPLAATMFALLAFFISSAAS